MADEISKDEEPEAMGDAMIVATSMLKPPKAVTAMKVLPRTIEWERVFWVAGGALVGLIVCVVVFRTFSVNTIYAVVLGAAGGYVLPSLSPLEGESLLKWGLLRSRDATAQRVNVNGRKAKMYIGTYPLKRAAAGAIRLIPAGVEVKAPNYDERGYPAMTTNKSDSSTLLEQQRRARTAQQKGKGRLRPSASLQAPPMSRSEARKQQQARSAPRAKVPKAGARNNVPSTVKETTLRRRRRP